MTALMSSRWRIFSERGVPRPSLVLSFSRPDPREVVLLRVQEHPLEEVARGLEGRRVAGAHAPVDLDQRLFGGLDGVLLDRGGHHGPDLVPLGEEDLEGRDLALGIEDHREDPRRQGLVGFENRPRRVRGSTDVGDGPGAFEVGLGHLDLGDLQLVHLLEDGGRHLLAGVEDLIPPSRGVLGTVDRLAELQTAEIVGDLPEELRLADLDLVHAEEGLDELGVGLDAHGAQEDRRQELALAVDADVEKVLGVVLELDPAPAVRDDLRREEALLGLREEDPGRSVELADDDPLGAVDDERAVLRHQRDVAEVDLLLLDVPDGLGPGLGVLVPHDEADRHLQGNRERHSPLLALVDVVLELQADRLVARVAGGGLVLVQVAALGAVDLAVATRVGDEGRAAEAARPPQLVEAHHAPALALPVPDGVLDELEGAVLPEVGDREDALEDRLKAGVLPLAGQHPHLEEALVRVLLDLDQVRNGDRCVDLREIDPFPINVLRSRVHLA